MKFLTLFAYFACLNLLFVCQLSPQAFTLTDSCTHTHTLVPTHTRLQTTSLALTVTRELCCCECCRRLTALPCVYKVSCECQGGERTHTDARAEHIRTYVCSYTGWATFLHNLLRVRELEIGWLHVAAATIYSNIVAESVRKGEQANAASTYSLILFDNLPASWAL